MAPLLGLIARVVTGRPRLVIVSWMAALAAIIVASAGVSSRTGGDSAISGTDSAAASALLRSAFPDGQGTASPFVLQAKTGQLPRGAAERVAQRLTTASTVDHAAVGERSRDHRTQLVQVNLSVDPADLTHAQADALLSRARETAGDAVQVEAAGPVGQKLSRVPGHRSEAIGLLVAIAILLLVGGTVPSMLVPIATAIAGLVLGLRTIALLGSVTSLPNATVTLATMIGLGVGIDYALFLLARIRGFRGQGATHAESVQRALATTGSAVLFAATTVAIALCSLAIAGLAPVTKLGGTAAITVITAVLAALTLLPALTMVLGDRLERLRVRRTTVIDESASWARWGHRVARARWRALLLAVLVLAVLSAPTLRLQLGSERLSDGAQGTTQRAAFDLISGAFGPGAAGPITVVARLPDAASGADDPDLAALRSAIVGTAGVVGVSPPRLSDDRRVVALTVTSAYEPGAPENADLVAALRTQALPGALAGAVAHVGGPSVIPIDLATRVGDALPRIIATVVGLAFLLLLLAFRSIVLPAKAALANLLSVGAAYGVLTAVFQHGMGATLIGLEGPVPVVSYVPMMMFAVLFGLSMDYEVFLLSRVQEYHHGGASDEDAIVRGLASTGRLITAAAMIMVAVFGSFILNADPTIKMFGVGLSVAIAVDATIVRCLLVPSAMLLMGRANWWVPRWLDRRLPRVVVD